MNTDTLDDVVEEEFGEYGEVAEEEGGVNTLDDSSQPVGVGQRGIIMGTDYIGRGYDA